MLLRTDALPASVEQWLRQVTSVETARNQDLFAEARTIGVGYRQQERDAWCWAAAAEMVLNTALQSGSPRQCEIVNLGLGRDDCCSPGNALCDRGYGDFHRLFTAHQVQCDSVPQPFEFADLRVQIDANKPLVYSLGFGSDEQDGHTGVIGGYAVGGDGKYWVYFLDPDSVFFGDFGYRPHGWIPYAGLVRAFGIPHGSWVDTWYNLQGGPLRH